MVTIDPETRYETAEARKTSRLDDHRVAWVVQYRQNHPEADWWAEGFAALDHSVETQERVFRMAEQLVVRGIDRRSVFTTLHRADLDERTSRGRPIQTRYLCLLAATVGCGIIDALLADQGAVVDLLPLDVFWRDARQAEGWRRRSQAGNVLMLIDQAPQLDHLRAHGFDPITFDHRDPAAYAWAIFELASRAQAAGDQVNCDCHRRFKPVPIGVAIDRSSAAP